MDELPNSQEDGDEPPIRRRKAPVANKPTPKKLKSARKNVVEER